jgi:hypothetical protein
MASGPRWGFPLFFPYRSHIQAEQTHPQPSSTLNVDLSLTSYSQTRALH